MIRVRELSKNYGATVALAGISFSAEPGQIVGLLGPNGAGKSTLMKILVGTLSPTGGSAFVDGIDVTSGSFEVRRRLGYLPENNGLYLEMRIHEYLKHRAVLKHLRAASLTDDVERVLACCGLADIRHRIIGQLSKGYRQRVGLAAAMLGDPPLLILDEPTVGLDPLQMREIRDLVRTIGATRTVLFSTHILSEAEVWCDRIIILDEGRKLLDTTVDDLRKRSPGTWMEIEVLPPADAALKAINGISGMEAEVMRRDATVHLRARSHERSFDLQLRADIASALARSSSIVLGLRMHAPSIDDVFVRLTAERSAR